jgi:hypothetical protein
MTQAALISDSPRDAIDGIIAVIDEGSKNGTPKLGLLLALIECCTNALGQDFMVDELTISGEDLADAYLGVHWTHVRPFGGQGVLHQLASSNREHFAITKCAELRELLIESGDLPSQLASWDQAKALLDRSFSAELKRVLREVRSNLWRNPIKRLQQLNGIEWVFLYPKPTSSDFLILNPGVGNVLAEFGPVLRPFIERQFAQIVEELNAGKIGVALADTVYGHLFLAGDRLMPNREARTLLHELQTGRCMWTGTRIDRDAPADHVAPWSRRRVTVMENFVLATTTANSSKAALLLSRTLLVRWLSWLEVNQTMLATIATKSSFVSGPDRVVEAMIALYRTNRRVPIWSGPNDVSWPTTQELDHCVVELENFKRSQVNAAPSA